MKQGMLGLGMTPEQAEQADREAIKNRAFALAQLSPEQGMIAAALQAGGNFGHGVGNMMGGKTDNQSKADRMQIAQQQASAIMEESGIDPTSQPYEASRTIAKVLMENGMQNEAAQAMKFGDQYKPVVQAEEPYWDEQTKSLLQKSPDGTIKRVAGEPKAGTTINNNMNGENEFSKQDNKFLAEDKRDIRRTGMEATGDLMLIRDMKRLVEKVPESGNFAELQLGLSKTLKKFGMEKGMIDNMVGITDVASAEAYKSRTMDFVMKRIAQTKGAISEKEMKAFESSVAGIKNTPEGNKMILDFAEKVANRQKLAAKRLRKYGRTSNDFLNYQDDWEQYIDANPLKGYELKNKPNDDNQNSPQVGTVVDGYKFLGGDPANPESWGQ
jgi:hypothetical protein